MPIEIESNKVICDLGDVGLPILQRTGNAYILRDNPYLHFLVYSSKFILNLLHKEDPYCPRLETQCRQIVNGNFFRAHTALRPIFSVSNFSTQDANLSLEFIGVRYVAMESIGLYRSGITLLPKSNETYVVHSTSPILAAIAPDGKPLFEYSSWSMSTNPPPPPNGIVLLGRKMNVSDQVKISFLRHLTEIQASPV